MVKNNIWIKFSIIILIILDTSFMYLIEQPQKLSNYNSYRDKTIITIIVLLMFCIWCFNNRGIFKFSCSIGKLMLVFLITVLLLVLFSSFRYGQNVMITISASYHYLILLLYFVLVDEFKKDSNLIFEVIKIFTLVSATFSVLLILYSVFNIIPLHIEDADSFLSNNRITAPADFITFSSFLICVQAILKKRIAVWEMVVLLINIIEITLVSRTRSSLLIILVGIVWLLWVIHKLAKNKLFYQIGTIVLFGGIYINWPKIVKAIDKLFSIGRSLSLKIRFEEIMYYLPESIKNGLFGIGFIGEKNTHYLDLLHGINRNFYLSDIGVLGFVVVFGFVGIIFILLLLIEMIRILKNVSALNMKKVYYLLLLYFGLMNMITSLFNIQRIMYFSIWLALFDSLWHMEENYE